MELECFYEKIIKSIFDKSWDRNNFLKEGKQSVIGGDYPQGQFQLLIRVV